jgi:2-amino-4-hydroxy-6-hydroxymethyldihydropteridine diphosphokinase
VDRVAVALGSNLGDRRAHVDFAVSSLQGLLSELRVSSYIETVPFGVEDAQPLFLNAAATGTTGVSPADLLRELLSIEHSRGRERPHPKAARTLDLDLVLYGERIIEDPDLIVPHPRFRERRFVLEPLAQIAPDMRDPVSGLTIVELLSALDAGR